MKTLSQVAKDHGSDLKSIPTSHAVGYSAKSYAISVTNGGRILHQVFKKIFKQNCVRRRHLGECASKYLATLRLAPKADSSPALKWVKSGFEPTLLILNRGFLLEQKAQLLILVYLLRKCSKK